MSGDNLVVTPSGELPFACACAMRCDEYRSSRPRERSGAEAEREDGFASGENDRFPAVGRSRRGVRARGVDGDGTRGRGL